MTWIKYLLGTFLSVSLITHASAQDQALTGRLIDRETGNGISLATITLSATDGVVSDANGNFILYPKKYPTTISISHVSYGAQSFTINYAPKERLIFRLEAIRTEIPEVFVSGKALQQLTFGADFSVYQFEFDQYYMWILGMTYNNPKNTRLFLANLIGDTLTSIPVELPANLSKDIFGYVHLETMDSVFQLATQNNEIRLYHGALKTEYNGIMRNYQATLGKGLVFFAEYQNLSESFLYYIDSSMNRPARILKLEEKQLDTSWLPDGLKQMGEYLGARTVRQILMQQLTYLREFPMPSLFKVQDSLCLIDLDNSLLHTIGPNLELIRSVPLSIHHQAQPTLSNLFIPFHDIQVDQLTNQTFVIYHRNNEWRFVPLDHTTGQTKSDIDVPRFNAMSNIRFHGGAIYFIYPEKLYPYYQRIFRKPINEN